MTVNNLSIIATNVFSYHYNMYWKLNSTQIVNYHNTLVTFKDGACKIYLNREQFLNFHDACQLVKISKLRIHLLIDKNIWLHSGNTVSIMIHDRGNRISDFPQKHGKSI